MPVYFNDKIAYVTDPFLTTFLEIASDRTDLYLNADNWWALEHGKHAEFGWEDQIFDDPIIQMLVSEEDPYFTLYNIIAFQRPNKISEGVILQPENLTTRITAVKLTRQGKTYAYIDQRNLPGKPTSFGRFDGSTGEYETINLDEMFEKGLRQAFMELVDDYNYMRQHDI